MKESVQSRVMRVLSEVFDEAGDTIPLNSKIGTDFALTSLDRMTLFVALEDEFDQTIPQEEVEGLETLAEVIEFIDKKAKV